jgi:endonuclease IV|tara:strand:- start:2082 stop:2231 length:150 start_codon:yes stop_codon:yes gene_type:complete
VKKLKDFKKELKQRNLVHLNAPRSGAGKHSDQKRKMKQGYMKHKGKMYG